MHDLNGEWTLIMNMRMVAEGVRGWLDVVAVCEGWRCRAFRAQHGLR